ncbi:MAG: hypothetical protein CMP23_05265 [Rickettsiales bacterium]|nr:hypothetical protein [Rickettsiales bacterium]
MRPLLLLIVVSLVGLVSSVSPVASAREASAETPAARAEEHSRLGVEYYQQGLYKEAVHEMMLAYEQVPDATLLYNVARIYQKMEKLDLAVQFFKRFVAHEGADPGTVQEALGHMEALEQQLQVAAEPADVPTEPVAAVVAEESAESVVAGAEPVSQVNRQPALALRIAVPTAAVSFGLMGTAGVGAMVRNQQAGDLSLDFERRLEAKAEAETMARVADVALAVGAGATIASVVALVVKARATPSQQSSLLLLPLGPGTGPGLSLAGTFGAGAQP